MKFSYKELEEILTVNEQAKALCPGLSYTNELGKEVFDCMKNKKELNGQNIQQAHNNYLALCIMGLNYCNSNTFKKLDDYMDNKY